MSQQFPWSGFKISVNFAKASWNANMQLCMLITQISFKGKKKLKICVKQCIILSIKIKSAASHSDNIKYN